MTYKNNVDNVAATGTPAEKSLRESAIGNLHIRENDAFALHFRCEFRADIEFKLADTKASC